MHKYSPVLSEQSLLQSSPRSQNLKMFKTLSALALLLAVASAQTIEKKGAISGYVGTMGVVDPSYRCGGVGTPLQMRISDCDGICRLQPGKVYDCEKDFMPSSAAVSLTLKVEVCLNSGFCHQIINVVLPGSSVQPGAVYTAKYSIVPNDILAGQTVEFRAYLLHTDNQLLEICVAADIVILLA